MAARRTLPHAEVTRLRIRSSMLVNALMDHVDGKRELSATQVRAAEILLRKVVPDLASVEHSGEIKHAYAIEVPAPAATVESWTQTQTPRLQ